MEVQKIIQSKSMAKAIIMSGGKLEIVAVFAESTQRDCYFVFNARKPSTAQSEWTLKAHYPSYDMAGRRYTFDEFVLRVTKLDFPMAICHVETKLSIGREKFDAFIDRVINPMKYVKPQVPQGATFNRVGRQPQKSWFRTRNRAFDSLPTPKDAVLVYLDFCPECGKTHSIAHWPAGNTKCMGYAELMKNPGLQYITHENGQFVFRFRVEFQDAARV